MLILTREEQEAVWLVDQVTGEKLGRIFIAKKSGSRVRLGFEHFPRKIRIMREEICDQEHEAVSSDR